MVRSVVILVLVAPLAIGCAGRPALRRSVADPAGNVVVSHATPTTPAAYTLGCPDVLAVTFADRPHAGRLAAIDLDGRLPLGDFDPPPVQGLTLDEARHRVAHAAGCSPDRVTVKLADARTGRLYVHGPEQGRQRTVEYVGPERLTDFLARVAALKPGHTDIRDVCVVRPNVAAGGTTEVFRADLEAIADDGDHTTNVLLRAGDQVYVGETRRSSFARLLPEALKPGYRKLLGLLPDGGWGR